MNEQEELEIVTQAINDAANQAGTPEARLLAMGVASLYGIRASLSDIATSLEAIDAFNRGRGVWLLQWQASGGG